MWALKWKYITLIGKTRAVFSKWQTFQTSLETICLHPPDPCIADAHRIGSACAEYQRAFIESRLWRNASRAKEQHAADTSRWWLKGCFCLSSLRTTYTALFITFSSELEWCCRKSVQNGRCIKVVDYSLVVDVAMDGPYPKPR